jgi:hypothetical protein
MLGEGVLLSWIDECLGPKGNTLPQQSTTHLCADDEIILSDPEENRDL